ncbi:MAG: sulfite exporter TauE/SafE family protein [bacterium]|nr:MAG: sulfite exporter TauE/SafE family protein [bacterium]
MSNFSMIAGSALWLGVLTSLSPCPLATNIAAISYIGRRIGMPRQVFLAGLLYTIGRTLAYMVLGILLVASLLTMHAVSSWLQTYMNKLIIPILILAGMFLLELLKFGLSLPGMTDSMQRRIDAAGIWGAGLLGILFALSFCPISAALFFGSLIPLAATHGSRIILPSLYGVGTGLPVLLFALLIAFGTRRVAQAFDKITSVELWARRITGVTFIIVGIYLSLVHIFGIAL